jgi:poly(hydroxyalkanoate) depolymerase family esterase
MNSGIREATRLTREGRLAEATALIQRTLRGERAPPNASVFQTSSLKAISPTREIGTELVDGDAASAFEAPPSAPADTKTRPSIRATVHGMPTVRPIVSTLPSLGELRIPGLEKLLERRSTLRPIPEDVVGPGQWIAGTYNSVLGTRDYKLYIPSGFHGQALPLVVMLHGCTQTPDDFAVGTGMNGVAETEEFLVAYPAQVPAANTMKCWNWFEAAHQQREEGEPSLIAGITRQVMAQYNTDRDRVYVAGLSAGGAMAAIMGEIYPDLFAAVGVHSGLAPGSAKDLQSAFRAMRQGGLGEQTRVGRPAPLILFHGDGDSTVHPCNADDLVQQWNTTVSQGLDESAPPVTVQKHQVGGRAYTRELYRDGREQPVVERWTIHGAGHAWSGGNRNGSYADPAGPDASREFVRFFQEHPRAITMPPPVS